MREALKLLACCVAGLAPIVGVWLVPLPDGKVDPNCLAWHHQVAGGFVFDGRTGLAWSLTLEPVCESWRAFGIPPDHPTGEP